MSEDIKREITAIIRELKDPRVADRILTVVRVETAHDLSFCKVYISSMDGIDDAKEAVGALEHAKGLIRRELGARLYIKKSPDIRFYADESVQKGIEMFRVLSDKERARHD
ncbi:MAG: 30S ribosome-binding factor RbfA [Clostridia bacterium]|nr:30S ribosome-binding factor RbfA [Clostridia bacterium]